MIGIDAHAVIFMKHVGEMILFRVSCSVYTEDTSTTE